MARSINIYSYGYANGFSDRHRCTALQKAIDTHGVEKVITRLNEIKEYTLGVYADKYIASQLADKQLEEIQQDVLYVLSKQPLPEEGRKSIFDLFIECIKVNLKKCICYKI
jgi:hypothetical protein